MDWLNVLNFTIDRAHYCIYGLPVVGKADQSPDFSQGLSRRVNLPVGAVYVIVARKQIGTFTPMRPVWRTQSAFGKLSVVRPARRGLLSSRKDGD